MSDKPILGPDGNPVHRPHEDAALPLTIQAFIEARVSTEVAAARETMRREADEDRRVNSRKALIRYGALVLANLLFGIFIWVFDSTTVKELTREYVADNMNKPALEAAAKDVITNKMGVFVSRSLQPLAQDVASIWSSITNAEQAMQRLRDEQRLIAVVSRAEALDAEAFRELRNLALGTNEMASLADEMVRKVERTLSHDKAGSVYSVPIVRSGEKQFGGPFTSEEIAYHLSSPEVTEGYVNVIANEKRMFFVPKLVELAHSSRDLWVINRVSLALKEMVGVEFSPWDLRPLDQWWSQHKASYTNWPYGIYARAKESFSSCKYGEALGLFESVLAVDPAADQSRAFAVACAAELGDVAKTKQLNAGYAQKDGRWEQWAKGNILLATGATNEGTKEFAALVKTFPLMEEAGFIRQGNHFVRNMDWRMFSELVAETTNPSGNRLTQVNSNLDQRLPQKPDRTNTNSSGGR